MSSSSSKKPKHRPALRLRSEMSIATTTVTFPSSMNNTRHIPILSIIALVCAGCISSQETVVDPTPRVAVSFATETASTTFHAALGRYVKTAPRAESSASFNLILINATKRTIQGPHTHFNQAVAMADLNRDGIISETEASDFAAAIGTQTKTD
jgi:hypothetical protein